MRPPWLHAISLPSLPEFLHALKNASKGSTEKQTNPVIPGCTPTRLGVWSVLLDLVGHRARSDVCAVWFGDHQTHVSIKITMKLNYKFSYSVATTTMQVLMSHVVSTVLDTMNRGDLAEQRSPCREFCGAVHVSITSQGPRRSTRSCVKGGRDGWLTGTFNKPRL